MYSPTSCKPPAAVAVNRTAGVSLAHVETAHDAIKRIEQTRKDVMSETLQLTVTGMTCGGCEKAVKRALGQLQGVEDVTASHQASLVGVTFDASKITPAVLKQRIEELGYGVQGHG